MKVVVIGAGLTGLSAALNLKSKADKVVVLERAARPGGLSRTEKSGNFKFDYTGHFLHFNSPDIQNYVNELFADSPDKNLLEIERNSRIFFRDRLIPYPFQSNIAYLPLTERRKCLLEFFKNLRNNSAGSRPAQNNFYDWLLYRFGRGILKYFMVPYNKKLWTVHPRKLTTEWMDRFVPRPSPGEVIKGALSERKKKEGYNATFFYPEGGIGNLAEILAGKVCSVNYSEPAQKIDIAGREVQTKQNNYKYDYLISTVPLNRMVKLIKNIPSGVNKKFNLLTASSLLNINIGWRGAPGELIDKNTHWIYFPDEKFKFYRVGFPPAVSRRMSPPGSWSAYVEISYPGGSLPAVDKHKDIAAEVVRDLKNLNIIPAGSDILKQMIFKIEPSYVIYNKHLNSSRNSILNFLEKNNIFCGGRYGGWEYSTMEEALVWGDKLAKKCVRGQFI